MVLLTSDDPVGDLAAAFRAVTMRPLGGGVTVQIAQNPGSIADFASNWRKPGLFCGAVPGMGLAAQVTAVQGLGRDLRGRVSQDGAVALQVQ